MPSKCKYSELRVKYIPNIRDFTMQSENIDHLKNIATFIYHALMLCKDYPSHIEPYKIH